MCIFCLCILKKAFFKTLFILLSYYIFTDIKSKGKMQLRRIPSIPNHFIIFWSVGFFLRFYLFFSRERGREEEREEEKHQSVASHLPSTRDLARSPGMCPDSVSNLWPFGFWHNAQPTEPHQSELFVQCFKTSLSTCYPQTQFKKKKSVNNNRLLGRKTDVK